METQRQMKTPLLRRKRIPYLDKRLLYVLANFAMYLLSDATVPRCYLLEFKKRMRNVMNNINYNIIQ